MKIDNKVAYQATFVLVSILAFVGAVLAAVDFVRAALVFLGLALSGMPLLGHLRMRQQLAAVRRMPQTAGAAFDGQPLLDQLAGIERKVSVLAEEQNAIQNRGNADISHEIQDAVNQLRRESRMSRIAAAQIAGKL